MIIMMKSIHDWMLALVVLLLVGIDVFILTIYMAIEGVRDKLNPIKLPDREVPEMIEGVSQ